MKPVHVFTDSVRIMSPRHFEAIQDARARYYERVFERHPQEEIEALVRKMNLTKWRDPNRTVGSRETKEGQAFSSAHAAILETTNPNTVFGFSYYANNASASRSGVLGRAELLAKLYLPTPEFRSHRYRVVREVVVPSLSEDVAKLLIEPALWGAEKQPKAAYVFTGEEMVIEALRNFDFRPNEEFNAEQLRREPVLPAVADAPAVHIQRFDLPI